jgi:hypothetical protein
VKNNNQPTGTRYRDLRESILNHEKFVDNLQRKWAERLDDLDHLWYGYGVAETLIREFLRDLGDKSMDICHYCHKIRRDAHAYIGGEEVACPNFASFPDQIKGLNSTKRAVTNG